MQLQRLVGIAAATLMLATTMASPTSAQVVNPQRDCQTLLKCNYAKGGSFRGCISSYSCKSCRMVAAKCTVRGESKCQRMQCGFDI